MIVSGKTLATPLQWNSIDNLVNASGDIVSTFDAGIKRVSGVMETAYQGGISQDGYLYDVHMDQAKATAYNNAILEVQQDNFSKTAAEYLAEQSLLAEGNFSAAVDQYVNAASIFIEATAVSNIAQEAQMSGDAVMAQNVQSYVTNNNVLITEQNVIDYNDALDTVELAGEVWATVEAVYQNSEAVMGLQAQADQLGYDFANADDLFLDRYSEMTQSAAIVFNHNAMEAAVIFADVQSNLMTIEEMNMAGEQGGFYNTGPTQNPCFFDMESPECVEQPLP